MLTNKMQENAEKIAFLIQEFPDKKLPELVALFQMPAIDINSGLWAAEELGYIAEPNRETGELTLLKTPDKWEFGDDVRELENMIVFCLATMNSKEQDIEETYFNEWTRGHLTQNVFVAVKHLINTHQIGHYDLVDPKDRESSYTFYTLFQNIERMWGKKQFEVEPTGDEKLETPGTGESDGDKAT